MTGAIEKHSETIPAVYSEAVYQSKKYGLSRTNFNNGNGEAPKFFTEELGGNISTALIFTAPETEICYPVKCRRGRCLNFYPDLS